MSWDPSEFGLDAEPDDAATGPMTPDVAAALVGAVAVATPVSPYARRMSAVEEKITMATYYKSVLDMDFFEGRDHFTAKIEAEIKDFVVKRMESLVNGTPMPAGEEAFTPEETRALKLWAKKLLAPKPAPAPAPVAAPAPPVAAPPPVKKQRRLAKVPGAPPKAEKPAEAAAPAAPPPGRGRRRQAAVNPNAIPVPTGTAFSAASEMSARQQMMANPQIQALGELITSQKE